MALGNFADQAGVAFGCCAAEIWETTTIAATREVRMKAFMLVWVNVGFSNKDNATRGKEFTQSIRQIENAPAVDEKQTLRSRNLQTSLRSRVFFMG